MVRRPQIPLFIAFCMAGACATTVDLASLPERAVTDLREPACTDADLKTVGKDVCWQRRKDLITRVTASTVRITSDRYDPEKGEGNFLGTGVILDETGIILTAYHVIKDADFVLATERRVKEHDDILYFVDIRHYPVRVVYTSEKRDVALLLPMYPQKTSRMLPIPIRKGVEPMVGEHLWQFGLTTRIADGVTDKWPMRQAGTFPVMQTKMKVAKGDSGGPVVTDRGELVGIVLSMGDDESGDLMYYMPIGHALQALRPWLTKTRVIEVVPEK